MVTRRLQAERRTGSVRLPKTGVLPTVQRNQTADESGVLSAPSPPMSDSDIVRVTPLKVLVITVKPGTHGPPVHTTRVHGPYSRA